MNKKKYFFLCLFIILLFSGLTSAATSEISNLSWQTEKSQHFVIYYQEAPAGFIRELIYKAEGYYNGIVDRLGYRRLDFWSWDNRAKIYLYQNAEDFHKATQQASWSGAAVSVDNRTIKSFIHQQGFLDTILPHEMTHIIFREFIGPKIMLPLWIEEGVACSQEKNYLNSWLQIAKNSVLQNKYIKFDKFFEIYELKNIDPQLFYGQSASIIIFLIRQYGKEDFLNLSRKLRDKVGWQQALLSVYNFASFDEMERKWKAFILK